MSRSINESIPRRFAIAAKEVTIEQYQRFTTRVPRVGSSMRTTSSNYSPDPDRPMHRGELVSSPRPIATG